MKKRQRVSLLIWCLFCAIVICAFLPALLVERQDRMTGDRKAFVTLVKHWEIAFGTEKPSPGDWTPLNADTRAAMGQYRGTVWLQRTLPELDWRSPYLFFSMMNRFEAYLDGNLLYRFNMDENRRHINGMKVFHPVPVSPQDEGKTLLIRTEWTAEPLFGNDLALAGEPDQILYALIKAELSYIVYSILGITAGIVGLALFLRSREALFGWFSLFVLAIGFSFLLSCRSLQWFVQMKEVYYWQLMLVPISVWAGIGFYGNALPTVDKRLVRIAHVALTVLIASVVVCAIGFPEWYKKYTFAGVAIAVVIMFSVVSCVLALQSGRKAWAAMKEVPPGMLLERQWLMRGYWTFMPFASLSLISNLFPDLLTVLLNSRTYLYRIIEGLMPNSLFLFIICMAMVLVSRVRRVHLEAERSAAELLVKNQELEHFHRNLEDLVEQRTAELEQANRTLAVTLREKAETLAEMSVLEERNRISYEMHDVVGHTLTAAIVQLEATKKLTAREGSIQQEKLELLSELVRKGLNDIRKAVRLMKSDEEQPLPLEASLRELIQYTEDTMEIKVDSEISLPPELPLGKVTEGVLYHALQEGLTNGIRHGRGERFRFTLRTSDGKLMFRLVNDGLPFGSETPGFGLTAMMERVELLGGSVAIRSSAAPDGSPAGCELAIVIPLSA